MTTSFARRVFFLSGVIGILFVFPMYFLEGRISGQQPPAITHPEYYYGFVGVTLVWQILFLVIASNPIKYRTIMLVGVLEKVSWGLAIPMLFAAGRVPGFLLLTAFVDLVWAVLFAIAYGKTPAVP
jgi:heme/copper-type cytochrome/quinol oxidase subunit 3